MEHREPPSRRDGQACPDQTDSNILYFHQKVREVAPPPFALYLTNNEEFAAPLKRSELFTLLCATQLRQFENGLAHQPKLVFIESNLEWFSPLQAISVIQQRLDCAVVLIQMPTQAPVSTHFLKRAFELGLTDLLTSPLDEEELNALSRVLLQLSYFPQEETTGQAT